MDLYRIINLDLFPPEYLGYVDPDDHFSYSGILQTDGSYRPYNDMLELLEHVKQRRASLSLEPIENLQLVIEHYLYLLKEAPFSYFTRIKSDRTLKNDVNTGARLALSLSKAAVSGILTSGSGGWATKTEANRRAEICFNCPLNRKSKNKSRLTRFNDIIANVFTPLRKTDYDQGLEDCRACGCPMAIKVHYSKEVIKEVTPKKYTAKDFPEHFKSDRDSKDKKIYACWMREILSEEE